MTSRLCEEISAAIYAELDRALQEYGVDLRDSRLKVEAVYRVESMSYLLNITFGLTRKRVINAMFDETDFKDAALVAIYSEAVLDKLLEEDALVIAQPL